MIHIIFDVNEGDSDVVTVLVQLQVPGKTKVFKYNLLICTEKVIR